MSSYNEFRKRSNEFRKRSIVFHITSCVSKILEKQESLRKKTFNLHYPFSENALQIKRNKATL